MDFNAGVPMSSLSPLMNQGPINFFFLFSVLIGKFWLFVLFLNGLGLISVSSSWFGLWFMIRCNVANEFEFR